jgi:N-acyl-D-amino-acid deacylase
VDSVLRGALVVDGSGAPARKVDVHLRGDVIAAVGPVQSIDDAIDVDLDGLMLAPGFIDPHTHFDAQVFWDPDLTPSSWHGVTTVVMGNCGFGIAPTRPRDRDFMLRTLERVEGMPLAALQEGIPWRFETFPQYLDAIEAVPKRINLAALLGHTPLRLYVMGQDALSRVATADEIATMRELVGEASMAGAVGFSTSKSPTHIGADNLPVPSRAASLHEIEELADVLGEAGTGVLQATWGVGLGVEEFAALAHRTGRPVTWTAIMADQAHPGRAQQLAARSRELGGTVYPQIACRPVVIQLQLQNPTLLARMPAFRQMVTTPLGERAARYLDSQWREQAQAELAADPLWNGRMASAVVEETEVHGGLLNGPNLGEIAAREGRTPFEVMIELALAEGLRTRFRIVLTNDDEEQITDLLQDDGLLLGLSDAGAHTSQLCDAGAPTHLLGYWCRERGALSWEDAVWRLTAHPAEVFGLSGRGLLRPGYAADLVAFDPETVGCEPIERVRDFPADTDRLITRSRGIKHVWVAGHPSRADDKPVHGAYHGRLLRNGR